MSDVHSELLNTSDNNNPAASIDQNRIIEGSSQNEKVTCENQQTVAKEPLKLNEELESQQQLGLALQNLLARMQNQFEQMSNSILNKMDEMGERIDELESTVKELMSTAGIDDSLDAPADSSERAYASVSPLETTFSSQDA